MPKTAAAGARPKPPTKGERTRSEILKAATRLFAAKGYDATGVRQIGEAVGVNPALINLYFGSKGDLFREVASQALAGAELRQGSVDQLGEQWARFTVQGVSARQARLKASNQSLQLLIRSAASPVAAATVRRAIGEQIVDPIASRLSGDRTQERAALIATYLLGFSLMQRVIGVDALAKGDHETLIRHLAEAVQNCVDDR
ncbi:MAG: transcriptional regulator [Hydrocarboniphaga sp.]|uniref:TetR/AcrR family transcriptional regulator n=1 Tax=Hydrocarboniphaga sp. TaxID=2033016 RepID=UPI00262B214B|nr:TetR family transcriptional regulator [Hydrocarboniphaga sp.]MDB5968033.1 transcriptional regulator [Hydrocarboniphaga sp.]